MTDRPTGDTQSERLGLIRRSTANIIADLRKWNARQYVEAADRLEVTELRVEQERANRAEVESELRAIDALRPPCPTCGGKGMLPCGLIDYDPCPDCVDGKVSIEQMAATWRTVWEGTGTLSADWGHDDVFDMGVTAAFDYLRAVITR